MDNLIIFLERTYKKNKIKNKIKTTSTNAVSLDGKVCNKKLPTPIKKINPDIIKL